MRQLLVPIAAAVLAFAPEARADWTPRQGMLMAQSPASGITASLFGQTEGTTTEATTEEEATTVATPAGPKMAVSINPFLLLGPIIGVYPLEVEIEMAMGTNLSVFVRPSFSYINFAPLGVDASGWGLGAAVGARYFVMNGPAVGGLWVGGEVGLGIGSLTLGTTSGGIAFSASGAALVGYNFLLGNFYLSPGIGVGIGPREDEAGNVSYFGLALRLNLGFAW